MHRLRQGAVLATLKFGMTLALLCSVTTAVGDAQQRPDFSGTWAMDPARSQSAVQDTPILSRTLVITQREDELRIETRQEGKTETVTYRPGAADTFAPGTGRSGLLTAAWYWDGAMLVTETLRNVSDATMRTRQVHVLDRSGNEMTVETLIIVEHGYTMRGAQTHSTGKNIFRRIP